MSLATAGRGQGPARRDLLPFLQCTARRYIRVKSVHVDRGVHDRMPSARLEMARARGLLGTEPSMMKS